MPYIPSTAISSAAAHAAELFYAEITTDATVTGTTEAAPTTIVSLGAQSYAAVPTLIEFNGAAFFAVTNQVAVIVSLWDDTTNLCRLIDIRLPAAQTVPGYGSIRLTPSAGTHTYMARGFRVGGADNQTVGAGSGSGGSGTYAPCYIRASLAT